MVCLHHTSPSTSSECSHTDVTLTLKCPPPQKRSPSIGGTRQANTATLTVRLRAPRPTPSNSSESTLVASAPPTVCDEDEFSDGIFSEGTDFGA
jgi:hypothetical protein